VFDADGCILCDQPGCGRKATMTSTAWPSKGHMAVNYWCNIHASLGAWPIEEDDDDDEAGDNCLAVVCVIALAVAVLVYILGVVYGAPQ
jgi:succinate dehydrogenase hydrophobic anchor subunit